MYNEIYYFNADKYKLRKQKKRYILISKMEFSILALNETGYLILSLMDGKRTVSEILEEVAAHYDISKETVKEYTKKFIVQMIEKKTIVKMKDYKQQENAYQCLNRVYWDLSQCEEQNSKVNYNLVREIVDTIEKEAHEEQMRFFINLGASIPGDECKKIINYIGSREFVKVYLFTDGCCITEKFLQEFKDFIEIMVLNISTYHRENDLKRICEKKEICKKYEKYFLVNVILGDENLESCLTLQQDMHDNKINGIFLDSKNIKNLESYNDFLDKLYLKNNFLNSWKNNRLQGVDNKIFLMSEKELCIRNFYTHKLKRHCGIGIEEMYIDSEGKIYPCHLSQKEDIHFNNIREFFEKQELLYGSKLKNQKCIECDSWCLCLGGCKMKNVKMGCQLEDVPANCDTLNETINYYYTKL